MNKSFVLIPYELAQNRRIMFSKDLYIALGGQLSRVPGIYLCCLKVQCHHSRPAQLGWASGTTVWCSASDRLTYKKRKVAVPDSVSPWPAMRSLIVLLAAVPALSVKINFGGGSSSSSEDDEINKRGGSSSNSKLSSDHQCCCVPNNLPCVEQLNAINQGELDLVGQVGLIL